MLHKDLTGVDVHETKLTLVSGSPVGSVTPSDVGILVCDSTSDTLYRSTGLTNMDWVVALPSSVTTQGNTFNGASQLVQLDGSGLLPAVDGSQLTNLPAGSAITALTGDVTASGPGSVSASVVKLQGNDVSSSSPSASDVLQWSGSQWAPTALPSIPSSSGTTGLVQFSDGSGGFSSDSTSGKEFLWDSTNHRLGIGTTSPSVMLDVIGQVKITDGTESNGYVLTTDATGLASWQALPSPVTSSGTSGLIQFSDGSGGFSSDATASNEFFWDSTNHRLGIGTTSPAHAIDLVASSVIAFGGKEALTGDGTDTYVGTHSTGGDIIFSPRLTEKMRLTFGGLLGIGTNSPASNLHVEGSTGLKAITFTAASNSAGDNTIILCDSTANNVDVALPAVLGLSGRVYFVVRTDSSMNTVTVTPNGLENIDGSNTPVSLTGQYSASAKRFVCDGTQWISF